MPQQNNCCFQTSYFAQSFSNSTNFARLSFLCAKCFGFLYWRQQLLLIGNLISWRDYSIKWQTLVVVHFSLVATDKQYLIGFWLFMPRHQKVAGYYVIPSEILSVRPSVCLSVCPSVRPSAPTTILVSATPPTVLGQSFWNFTGVLRMVWRYAYCFFRILKLFFITFFPFLT